MRAQAVWPWLECGYSAGIPGFERYAFTGVVEMWSLWSAKWLVLARLVELQLNVMMMDSDMLMLSDPYTLLHSPPLSYFSLILPPEGARVNVGYVYARGAMATGGGLPSLLWDVVRRLRLFLEQQTLRDKFGNPSVQGLWDQGVFSDALVSAVVGEYSYSFTWLHSPSAFANRGYDTRSSNELNWPPPGFTIANATSLLNGLWRRRDGLKCCDYEGQQQRVTGTRPSHLFPTLAADHPQRRGWSEPFAFLWNALRPLDPSVGILSDRKDLLPGWLKPAPWMTSQQSGVGAPDLVAAAPDWLHCTTGHWMMTAGWLSADKPVCSILHLVECRSQFAHFGSLDTLKSNRPYVMKAYGHWHGAVADKHLLEKEKEEEHSHGGNALEAPNDKSIRAIRLSSTFLEASASSSGVGHLLNALQILSAVAALTDRLPIIPSIPCTSKWLKRHEMTPNGIADDYVLQLPPPSSELAGKVSCHAAIGGAKCALPRVLPAWQRLRRGGSSDGPSPEGMPAVPLPLKRAAGQRKEHAAGSTVTIDLTELRSKAAALKDVPVLEIRLEDIDAFKPNLVYQSSSQEEREDAIAIGHRFACGLPVSLVDEDDLTADESKRLKKLRTACPAFFAQRGTKRHRLDWLHRRRRIRGEEKECASLEA